MKEKPETIWEVLGPAWDQLLAAFSAGNFDQIVRNPYFLGFSAIVIGVCFLKKWRIPLIAYLGGLGLWAIVHYAVLARSVPGSVGLIAIGIFTLVAFAVYWILIKE